MRFIRGVVGNMAGSSVADSLRIQYGGSMKPDNAAELIGQPDIDGGLIGGAPWMRAPSWKSSRPPSLDPGDSKAHDSLLRHLLIVLEVVSSILLIGVILIQKSKGGGLGGSAFGGGGGDPVRRPGRQRADQDHHRPDRLLPGQHPGPGRSSSRDPGRAR